MLRGARQVSLRKVGALRRGSRGAAPHLGRACGLQRHRDQEAVMARYGKAASKKVKKAMHEYKRGKLRTGRGGRGGHAKSRKQAIAIGLSQARRRGAKVPKKRSSRSRR